MCVLWGSCENGDLIQQVWGKPEICISNKLPGGAKLLCLTTLSNQAVDVLLAHFRHQRRCLFLSHCVWILSSCNIISSIGSAAGLCSEIILKKFISRVSS